MDNRGRPVKRVRTDEGLPLASGTRVTGDEEVGLEAELSWEGRLDFTLVATGSVFSQMSYQT